MSVFAGEKKKFYTKRSNKVAIFIFYQTGFPRKVWENNDKICVIIRYSVIPNGFYSLGRRFQVRLLSDLYGEINILLYFKAGD